MSNCSEDGYNFSYCTQRSNNSGLHFLRHLNAKQPHAAFYNAGDGSRQRDPQAVAELSGLSGRSLAHFAVGEVDKKIEVSIRGPDGLTLQRNYALDVKAEIRAAVAELQAARKAAQPTNRRTFGSVFKNPEHELTAGRMLEACGLRGHAIGLVQR